MADVVMRFHRSLYQADSVRSAALKFAALGEITVDERDVDTIVAVTGVSESLAARLTGEIGNHALFQTIVDRRA